VNGTISSIYKIIETQFKKYLFMPIKLCQKLAASVCPSLPKMSFKKDICCKNAAKSVQECTSRMHNPSGKLCANGKNVNENISLQHFFKQHTVAANVHQLCGTRIW
jgi:hypothetical protein